MIRFVDLRYQGIGYRFAFWDTVTNSFMELCGSQAWETFGEFEDELREESANLKVETSTLLERCKSLCPSWALRDSDNEEEMYGFKEDSTEGK